MIVEIVQVDGHFVDDGKVDKRLRVQFYEPSSYHLLGGMTQDEVLAVVGRSRHGLQMLPRRGMELITRGIEDTSTCIRRM